MRPGLQVATGTLWGPRPPHVGCSCVSRRVQGQLADYTDQENTSSKDTGARVNTKVNSGLKAAVAGSM